MTARIREWSSVEFSIHYTEQDEMQRMTKSILEHADKVDNKPTPGCSNQNISRVITAESSIITDTKYIIHVEGFTVNNITEIVTA